MNVGLVLCFPNAVSVLSRTQVLWEAWRQQTVAITAGPISASKFSTVHVAFQVDPLAQPGTVTLYLGANRGVVKPTMLSSRVQCGPDPGYAECCLNLGNLQNVGGTSCTSR